MDKCFKLFLKLCFLVISPLLFLSGCGESSALQGATCSDIAVRGIRNGDRSTGCAILGIAFIDAGAATEEYICTGVLITPRIVLTAGHCVSGGSKSMKITVAGRSVTSSVQAQHPQYDPNGYPTAGIDIGLVFLSQPLDSATPISLSSVVPPVGSTVTAFGFGLNGQGSDGNGGLGTLLEGTLQMLSYAKGTQALVARASTAKSQETCDGDSGGPLLFQGQVVGILSGGDAKGQRCVDSTNSTFTSIGAAMPWISSKLGL